MAKGFYTQGVAILLKAPVSIESLPKLLDGFRVIGKREASESWTLAGPSLLLEYGGNSKGIIQIDTVDRLWPDTMGAQGQDPALTAAWKRGAFGPFTFPGSLERACQQCFTWKDGPALASQHKAFLRVRLTYDLDAEEEAPTLPRGIKPVEELEMVLGVVEALLHHPSAIGYFNPNGEVLAPLETVTQIADHYHKASRPAIELLANRRIFRFEGSDWKMMDLVGMGQLDQVDLEVGFTTNEPNEIANFLVNTAHHIIQKGSLIKDGHTVTGPKGVLFEAKKFSEPKLVPPRDVLRFRPRDGSVSPPDLGFGDKPLGKAAWWQFWKL